MDSETDAKKGVFFGTSDEVKQLLNDWRSQQCSIEDLPHYVENIESDDKLKLLSGTVAIRKLLSIESGPPIQEVIDTGVVPKLVKFLELEDQPDLQYEAAWALTNVASGSHEQTKVVIDNGAIARLIRLLKSRHEEIVDQVIWAIGNIAGDSTEFRNHILQQGCVKLLVETLNARTNREKLRDGTWALSNLCRGKPVPKLEEVQEAIPFFCSMLQDKNEDTAVDAAWGLNYVSELSKDDRVVIPMGAISLLVKNLESSHVALVIPCIKTIGNIVAGTEAQTNMLVNMPDVIPKIFKLLDHKKAALRAEACWTLSNITAGTSEQVELVLNDAVSIKKLIDIATNDVIKVKKEAIWALSNAVASGTKDQVVRLVQNGVLDCFVNSLDVSDAKLLKVLLEGIEGILNKGSQIAAETNGGENPFVVTLENNGGLERIEELQTHPNQEIYEGALRILEKYFAIEEL